MLKYTPSTPCSWRQSGLDDKGKSACKAFPWIINLAQDV
jgi:hypothetical protein